MHQLLCTELQILPLSVGAYAYGFPVLISFLPPTFASFLAELSTVKYRILLVLEIASLNVETSQNEAT
jgi:hypothetical protein